MVETSILPSPAVAGILKAHFIEARIHNDHIDKGEEQKKLQTEMTGFVSAPYYLIVDPGQPGEGGRGKILGSYQIGNLSELDNNQAMLAFLQKHLD